MRVILLAAGMAPRLRPLTERTPKCLLEVGGRTILSRAIGALVAHGLRRFTIVDGFQGDYLRADVLAEFPAEWFEFIRNDDYATTGDACSLLLARPETPEPIFLLDSDIVFDRRVVGRMLAKGPPDRVAWGMGGELDDESIGLGVISAGTATELFRVLERRVHQEQRVNERYEESFVELIGNGLALHPVDLDDLACIEVDTIDDLARARWVFGKSSQSSRPESNTGAPSTGK